MSDFTDLDIEWTRHGKTAATLRLRDGDRHLDTDTVNVSSASARAKYIEQIAKKYPALDMPEQQERIEEKLLSIDDAIANADVPSATGDDVDPLDSMRSDDRAAALGMLRSPTLIQDVVDDIARLGVAGEKQLAATVYVIGTSRLLEKPLAGIVQGLTSSGKSYVNDTVARLFPPEAVIHAQKMTPEALVHMPEGSLVHRFVVAGERSRRRDDDAADATRALREMLSSGRLTKLLPSKRGGEIVTIQIDQPGPIAYVESTTSQKILDEDRNRCIVLNTDERPEQTRRIIGAMAERKELIESSVRVDDVIAKHHAAQRILWRCRIVIPFANRLGELFPDDRTDARRSFGHLLSMIEAIALLYQYQRTDSPMQDTVIEATRADYQIAHRLLADPMARNQPGGVSGAVRRFHERLRTYELDGEFTTADIAKREKIIGDIQTIREYVRTLAALGGLEQVEASRGSKSGRYMLSELPTIAAETSGLPSPDRVFANSADSSRVETLVHC